MEEQQKLMEAIEAKLDEHGLLERTQGGAFTAMTHVMKANPKFKQELAQAALDGMLRRLKAEAKKYKGNLGGWRGEVAAGFSQKRNLETISTMARGEMDRAVTALLQKMLT